MAAQKIPLQGRASCKVWTASAYGSISRLKPGGEIRQMFAEQEKGSLNA